MHLFTRAGMQDDVSRMIQAPARPARTRSYIAAITPLYFAWALVYERISQPQMGGQAVAEEEWTNNSEDCAKDGLQVIFNNSKGKTEENVTFHIVNRGQCPVRVATTRGRNSLGGGENNDIPSKAHEGVKMPVPAGFYLMAGCLGDAKGGCDWTITDLKP